MSVNGRITAISASDAAWMLADGDGRRLQDYEPSDHDELWVEVLWHGLHYLFSGIVEERPGEGPLGQVIFTQHRLSVPGPPPDAPFWLVTPSEVAEIAPALRDLDRDVVGRRYQDIVDRTVTVYWQGDYGDEGTRNEVFGYIDAITALYDRASAGGHGVLNLIA